MIKKDMEILTLTRHNEVNRNKKRYNNLLKEKKKRVQILLYSVIV